MEPATIDPPEISYELWRDFNSGLKIGYDVGANCGQTLPMMAELCDTVIAFEPAEECIPYLHNLCKELGTSFVSWAVSDHDGTVDLAAVADKISTGQLVTFNMNSMEWSSTGPGTTARTVACRTLDTITSTYGRPDLIKVDVEGHEDRVLAGAADILEDGNAQWLIEFHSADLHQQVTAILERHGYRTTTVRHPHYPAGSDMYYQHGWIKGLRP